ncbi:hypothetical protein, partial [Allofournierella massiliensis]|uniref:hypothetical protein n=1 Tax=Allofournierella massiliensis TaxID=1650663 RepID=UPI0024B16AA7
NLAPVEGLGLAAALLNLHGVSSRECLFCNVFYYTPHLASASMRKTHIWCVNYTEIVYKTEKINRCQKRPPG